MINKLLSFIFILTACASYSQESYYSDVNLQLTGTELKAALATKITSTHTNPLTYTPGVWEASKATDKATDPTEIVLIYGWENGRDQDITNDRTRDITLQDAGTGKDFVWNREHVFSKSLANPSLVTDNPGAGTDAYNLRPADKSRNSERNNYKFATGSGNSARSSETYNGPEGPNTRGWYPGDEWKGDVARIVMYMYLHYGDQCLPTAVGIGNDEFTPDNMIDLFLEWNIEDPVSEFEKTRNAYHENTGNTYAQGNRNPFVDNPYLATRIWGGDAAQDTWGIYVNSDTQAPTAPTNVVVSNITLTSLELSWTASTDDIGVTGYDIYMNDRMIKQTTATSTVITGLETNTSYTIKMYAKDLINTSEPAVVVAKTLEDTTPPSTPTNITVSNITDSSFEVNWSASSDDNVVASYNVYLDGSFYGNTTETTFTITGLQNTTTYGVSISAKDPDDNTSALSTTANATTTDGTSAGGASELFISEYVEGDGGTNKAIEIVNLTGSTVSLSGYVLKLERNGAGVWTTPLALDSGTVKSIVPGDVFVVGNGDNSAPELQPYSAANPEGEVDLVQPSNDDTNYGQPVNFNGDDAVALFKDDVLIDIIGKFGNGDNFAANVTLRRNQDISAPNTTFDLNGEWTAYPENTFDGIGSHASTLSIIDENIISFKVFPNPIKNDLNIVLFNTVETHISIYNILGKRVIYKTIHTTTSIPTQHLAPGIYIAKITQDGKTINKKLIKS